MFVSLTRLFFNWLFSGSSWTVTFSISECCLLHVACYMDAFFVRHKQVPRVFLSCRYPREFFGDHRSKTKFANDFPNAICIINCKPRYSKLELKNVFRIMGKTLLSVNSKIGSPVLLREFQMTLECVLRGYNCMPLTHRP